MCILKSVEEIVFKYGCEALSHWLQKYNFRHELKLLYASQQQQNVIKPCLIDLELDEELTHSTHNGSKIAIFTDSPLFAGNPLRIIMIDDFWNHLLHYLTHQKTDFPIRYFYRDIGCIEDLEYPASDVPFEYKAWKVINLNISANKLYLEEAHVVKYVKLLQKLELQYRQPVLKELKAKQVAKIERRGNYGKHGSFAYYLAMIQLCHQEKKSPSIEFFKKNVSKVMRLVVTINDSDGKNNEYFQFINTSTIQYCGESNPIKVTAEKVLKVITANYKNSALQTLKAEYYGELIKKNESGILF